MPAGPILKFALQTLKEMWREHKDLKNGEQRELEQLEDDLLLLQAFLKKSAEMADKNALFRAYEMRITELVYDVEDTIAICFAKKAAANTKNIATRFVQKFSINMAKQVKSLRKDKVKPIIDGIDRQFGKQVAGEGTTASLQNPPTEGTKVTSM